MNQVTNRTIINYYLHHGLRYPFLMAGMFLSAPLAVLFNEFLPALIVAGILDRLAGGDFIRGDIWGSFGPDILTAVGLAALGGIIIWRINMYCNWKLEGKVARDIGEEVFNHLMKMSATFHADTFGGSLVSQTNKLLGAYSRITDTTLYSTGGLLWSLIFTNIILWNKALFFVLLLDVFSVLFVIIAARITRQVRYYNKKEADASNRQTGQLADGITNVMAVKSFAAEEAENKRFHIVTEKQRYALMKLMFATMNAQIVFSGVGTVINLVAITSAVASVVVYNADITTVFLVFAYTTTLRDRLWDFSNNALRSYNRAFGDAQAMVEVLHTQPGVKDPADPEPTRIDKGAITFSSMSFAHDGSHKDDSLFTDLNLEIKSREKIGLVGHSGSGKTSLTKLLLRFNDIDDGEILIDGQNIARITQSDLRRHIAYVPQEPLLFHRSIHENIAYGNPAASDEEIVEAARKAYADEFIAKLPKGYDTLVGERGVKLSGGQRQRIAIARAILKDAPILVLDEATSALDSESEKLIQAALRELMKGRTTLVIAHRLSTIQSMDRILVLDNGTVIEEGSHPQLLKHKGTYAKLWAHQSGGFLEE
ncbi:MAG TPA: ABC transporter ATP-binding protein [Candidatus Limnocylindria bacterium]|nr:ABC transporter ATP-binding protein [Candidatus Limnocylindria bacterium]